MHLGAAERDESLMYQRRLKGIRGQDKLLPAPLQPYKSRRARLGGIEFSWILESPDPSGVRMPLLAGRIPPQWRHSSYSRTLLVYYTMFGTLKQLLTFAITGPRMDYNGYRYNIGLRQNLRSLSPLQPSLLGRCFRGIGIGMLNRPCGPGHCLERRNSKRPNSTQDLALHQSSYNAAVFLHVYMEHQALLLDTLQKTHRHNTKATESLLEGGHGIHDTYILRAVGVQPVRLL